MDCNSARLYLNVAGRQCQELTAADRRLLDQHLRECPDCAAQAKEDELFDQKIGRAMAAVPVPTALAGRILARLGQSKRRPFWPWLAAAACLLLALGGGLFWLLRPGSIDLPSIARDVERITAASPAEVEEWFADRGVTMVAPPQFRYGPVGTRDSYLESADVRLVQGRKVAHLLFMFPGEGNREAAVAHVYVAPADAIDINPDQLAGEPISPHTIEMIPHPNATAPQFYFMVVYTGRSLEPFKKRDGEG